MRPGRPSARSKSRSRTGRGHRAGRGPRCRRRCERRGRGRGPGARPSTVARAARHRSACVMRTDGMVMEGSVPPSPAGGEPAALSATTTAIAPASWAFFTLTVKLQSPRSTRATLPAIAAALVIAEQPSVAEGPAVSAASSAPARFPEIPGDASAGPNSAAPTGYSPATAAGVSTRIRGVPAERTSGTARPNPKTGPGDVPGIHRGRRRPAGDISVQLWPVDPSTIDRSKMSGEPPSSAPVFVDEGHEPEAVRQLVQHDGDEIDLVAVVAVQAVVPVESSEARGLSQPAS